MVDSYESEVEANTSIEANFVVALWEHPGTASDELTLTPGDIITVIEQPDEGWWVGELNGKIGLFPVAFCREALPSELDQQLGSHLNETSSKQETTQEVSGFEDSTSIVEYSNREKPNISKEKLSSSIPERLHTQEYDLNSNSIATTSSGQNTPISHQEIDSTREASTITDDLTSNNLSYRAFHQLYLGDEPELDSYLDDSQLTIDYAPNSPNLPSTHIRSDSPLLAGLLLDREPVLDLGREPSNPVQNEIAENDSSSTSSEESQNGLGLESLNLLDENLDQSTFSSPPFSQRLTELERRSVLLENEVAETISRRISEDDEKIVKEGILSIKAEQCTSGLLSSTKHWKQYRVVIKSSALLIYKYQAKVKKSKNENKEPPKFKGWFDLSGASALPAAKGQSKKRYVFCLLPRDSQLSALFQTEDEASYDSWLVTLKSTIKDHPPGNEVASFISELPRFKADGTQSSRVSQFRTPKAPRKKDKEGSELSSQSQIKSSGSKIALMPKSKMMGKLFNRPPQNNLTGPENKILSGSDSVWYTLAGDSDCISYVVKRCVEELETRNCLTSEGIYRLSGNASSIKAWKAKFTSIGPVSLANEPDINVITGVLKLFFRELTEPLFPFEAYDYIVSAGRIADYDDRLWAMKDLIHSQLNENSLTTLRFLITHLAAVAEKSDVNFMAAQNLAIVFGPTLARPRDPTVHPQLEPLFLLVESLIIQHEWFFEPESEAHT